MAQSREGIPEGVLSGAEPLGLTPLQMYRIGWEEVAKPAKVPYSKASFDAYFGDRFSLLRERKQEKAGVVDSLMVGLLKNPELAHIFTGTALDFDTIDELCKTICLAVEDANLRGFEAGFLAASETISVDTV